MLKNSWGEPRRQKIIIHLLPVRLDVDKTSLRPCEGNKVKRAVRRCGMFYFHRRRQTERDMHPQRAEMFNYYYYYLVPPGNEHLLCIYLHLAYNLPLRFSQQRAEGLESPLTFHINDFM